MSKYLIGCIVWAICTVLMIVCTIRGIVTQNWPSVGLASVATCLDTINMVHDFKKWKETR